MSSRNHFIHIDHEFTTFALRVDEFDSLIEEGFDDIVIVTPKARYVSSVEDWIDYAEVDDGDGHRDEAMALHRAHMVKR